MTREEIVDLFSRRLTAFNNHDVETLAEVDAEDAVVESPLGGTHQGRAAIAGVAGVFLGALSDARFTQDDLIIDGDSAVQVFTLSGTNTGGLEWPRAANQRSCRWSSSVASPTVSSSTSGGSTTSPGCSCRLAC